MFALPLTARRAGGRGGGDVGGGNGNDGNGNGNGNGGGEGGVGEGRGNVAGGGWGGEGGDVALPLSDIVSGAPPFPYAIVSRPLRPPWTRGPNVTPIVHFLP